MTYQLRNIVIAVSLGLLAAILTALYVTNYRKHVQNGQQSVAVLVASTDIPAGTAGSAVVSGHMLKTETVPRTALVPGAISNPDQIARLVSTAEVFQGEQVSTRRFGNSTQLGVRAELKGTARAIQVAGDPNQVLAGTLHAGDHVDLVGNLASESSAGNTVHVDRVYLRNLLVLKAPSTAGNGGNIGTQKDSVMLQVSDAQAAKFLFVVKNGDPNHATDGGWALELRPVTNAIDSQNSAESFETLVFDGLSPAARAHLLNALQTTTTGGKS